MTPGDALAVIGAISLFVVAVRAILAGLSRLADDRRARHATRYLVGRAYWSPDLVITAVDRHLAAVLRRGAHPLPSAAAARGSVITPQRPPRSGVFIVAAMLLAGWNVVFCAAASADPCGEERSAVKLGLDPDAAAVNTRPIDTTIAELAALRRPHASRPFRRSPAAETTVYRIHGTITAVKLEADGDFHLVIADDAGHHMIVEIPLPSCSAGGPWAKQIEAARDAAQHALHPTARIHRVAIAHVTVTGVGFFDVLHGQLGVAPNGIELHPALALEIGGGS